MINFTNVFWGSFFMVGPVIAASAVMGVMWGVLEYRNRLAAWFLLTSTVVVAVLSLVWVLTSYPWLEDHFPIQDHEPTTIQGD